MQRYLMTTAMSALVASSAAAGGLDRSGQSTSAIFNEDGTAAFSIGVVNPTVNAQDTGGANTEYSPAESYTQIGGSYTSVINDDVSVTFIFDQPYGAAVSYDAAQSTSSFGGTSADISTAAVSAYAKYDVGNNVSLFGGIRLQQAEGDVTLGGTTYNTGFSVGAVETVLDGFVANGGTRPAALTEDVVRGAAAGVGAAVNAYDNTVANDLGLQRFLDGSNPQQPLNIDTAADIQALTGASITGGGYSVDIEPSYGVGYSIGAAYEMPEIALRLAVTYHSSISHDSEATEQNAIITQGQASTNDIEFETPQSINIDFQTGIAEDTLLTAGVRWAEWGAFDVIPNQIDTDLADLSDSYTYRIGVARRFSEELAGTVSVTYEEAGDDGVSPLGPTDGLLGLTVGARYDTGGAVVSGGINYSIPGDADLAASGTTFAESTDNRVVGVGLQAQWTF